MWLIFFLLIPSILSYDIDTTFESVYTGTQNPPGIQFKYALDKDFRLFETSNLDTCKSLCLLDDNCRGVFNFKNVSQEICYGLTDIRYSVPSYYESVSLAKVYYHNKNTENNTIAGYSINLYGSDETEIYLDLNHNGKHDHFEPLTITNNTYFLFEDLSESMYTVKQKLDNDCYQMYPGIDGFSLNDYYNITGDGYADIVLEYFDSNTGIIEGPYGGVVYTYNSNNIFNKPAPFSYALGGNQSTFLSIPVGSYIIVAFTDESVINTDGDDIFIRELGSGGNEVAEISVSNDLENYEFLGYAYSYGETSFDLDDINFTKPVHAVKISVIDHGNGMWYGFDLSTVRVASNSQYIAPFSNNIPIPNNNENMAFINHCNYIFSCRSHCEWTEAFNNVLDSESCLIGCDNYDISSFNTKKYDDIYPLYNYSIKKPDFYKGYFYGLKKYVFPEYRFEIDQTNINIYKSINCVDCLQEALSMCTEDEFCKSISQRDGVIYFSNDDSSEHDSDSFTLTKYGDVLEITSSTTETTTKTNTDTSTPTSTQTITDISTGTTTITSTITSTETITFTSTPTSSITSSETTTFTSTPTSSITSSETTTFTSTPTSSITSSETTTFTSTPTSSITSSETTFTSTNISTIIYNESTTESSIILDESFGTNYTKDFNSSGTNSPSEKDTYLGLSWQVLVSIILGTIIFIIFISMIVICRRKKKTITPNIPQIESRTSYWNPIYDNPMEPIDEVVVSDYHKTSETDL